MKHMSKALITAVLCGLVAGNSCLALAAEKQAPAKAPAAQTQDKDSKADKKVAKQEQKTEKNDNQDNQAAKAAAQDGNTSAQAEPGKDAVEQAITEMGPAEDMLIYGRAAICFDEMMLEALHLDPKPICDGFVQSYAAHIQQQLTGVFSQEQALQIGQALLARVQATEVVAQLVSVDGQAVPPEQAVAMNEQVGREDKAKEAEVKLVVFQFDREDALDRAAQVFLANHPDVKSKPTPEQAPEFTELIVGSIRTARPVNKVEATVKCVFDTEYKHWKPVDTNEFFGELGSLSMVTYGEEMPEDAPRK